MVVLNNPVLGRNFRLSSLVLNEEGLHRLVRVENKKRMIFLTNDPKTIMALMDIGYEEIKNVDDEEAFPIFLKSEYFHPYLFTKDKEEKSRAINQFKEWLKGIKDIPEREHTPIRTARIEEILGESFLPEINMTKLVLEQSSKGKTKLQGKTLLPYLGDYDMRNFSTHIPKFKQSFEDNYKLDEFMVNNDVETIAEEFKRVNNIV